MKFTVSVFHRIFKKWALATDEENLSFIDFQGHDFSMRGMGGLQSSQSSGMGHATVFMGSDTYQLLADYVSITMLKALL